MEKGQPRLRFINTIFWGADPIHWVKAGPVHLDAKRHLIVPASPNKEHPAGMNAN